MDNVLRRHELKSFSTVYSHGRSNADHINAFETNSYKEEFVFSNLIKVGTDQVCRSTNIAGCDDIYHPLHSLGFEFTHHDPIGNQEHRQELVRRCRRMEYLKKNQDRINAFYFHRFTDKSQILLLRAKLIKLRSYYVSHGCIFSINLFYQKHASLSDRRLEIVRSAPFFNEYIFHTNRTWTGNDPNIMWALIDDDLIKEMLRDSSDCLE